MALYAVCRAWVDMTRAPTHVGDFSIKRYLHLYRFFKPLDHFENKKICIVRKCCRLSNTF